MENPDKNAERIELQKMSNANFIIKFLCAVHRFFFRVEKYHLLLHSIGRAIKLSVQNRLKLFLFQKDEDKILHNYENYEIISLSHLISQGL